MPADVIPFKPLRNTHKAPETLAAFMRWNSRAPQGWDSEWLETDNGAVFLSILPPLPDAPTASEYHRAVMNRPAYRVVRAGARWEVLDNGPQPLGSYNTLHDALESLCPTRGAA